MKTNKIVMTQEEKDLLVKDLCARLPYKVRGNYLNEDNTSSNDELLMRVVIDYHNLITCDGKDGMVLKGEIKPYLFPLSSMTKEQRFEYHNYCDVGPTEYGYEYYDCFESIDWLNAHHFDYRGLIEKGLAIDATGLNIY